MRTNTGMDRIGTPTRTSTTMTLPARRLLLAALGAVALSYFSTVP